MNSPTIRRAHRMPFGAEARQDGTTRFRVWAPAAGSVALWLEAEGRELPMTRDASGWAELVTRDAPAGTRYRFRIDGNLLVPDPASRFQPIGRPRAERGRGPARVWLDGRGLGRRGRRAPRVLRAARRRVHHSGNLRGRRRATRSPGLTRRHRHRADASGGVPRSRGLGIRRGVALRARVRLRTAGRPQGARPGLSRARPRRLPRRRLQPLRAGGQLPRAATRPRSPAPGTARRGGRL